MLSSGPMIFYSSDNELINSVFTVKEIEILKKLGCLVFIYSNIISMICFSLLSKINSTLVSGIIIESLRPMVNAYCKNIILETRDLDGYVTNFIFQFFITAIGFAFLSLFLFYIKKAHYLGLIPKCIINGCLGAVGIGQLNIALDCLKGTEQEMRNIPILFLVAFSVIVFYYILKNSFHDNVYLTPSYVLFLVFLFYILSGLFLNEEENLIKYLRSIEWLSSTDSVLFPNFVLERLDPSKISYIALFRNTLGILTIISISSIHLAVNLPAFQMATGVEFDFSAELKTQGLSNLFTFIPSYFIVSYSIAIHKSGGLKRYYSLIAGLSMIIVALYGVMIKGYIPKFALSLIPGIMFVDFMITSFYNTLFYVSVHEYLLSVFVSIIIKLTNEYIYGIIIGFAAYMLMFLIFHMKTFQNRMALTHIPALRDFHVIEVDYILWFYTVGRFCNELKNVSDIKLIIDCQKCCAIDWIGHDIIKKTCHDFDEVVFIGFPYNFSRTAFSECSNFLFFETHDQYFIQNEFWKHSGKISRDENEERIF